jgi:hypothetical protein
MDTVLLALLMPSITQLQGTVYAQMVSSPINGESALANVELMRNTTLLLKLAHVSLDWEESMVLAKFAQLVQPQLLMDQDAQAARPIKFLSMVNVSVNKDSLITLLEFVLLVLHYLMDSLSMESALFVQEI